MQFFGKVPLAAAKVIGGINHRNRSTGGVDTAVYRPPHWKCIRIGEIWGKLEV